ncbi:MAG: DUF1080 domain-containing protein [Puniceicoccales bacterium]|jgi:hypothetical protein|nr:DUF1080 domain-containing protein [Puniceicoccales bacterium]
MKLLSTLLVGAVSFVLVACNNGPAPDKNLAWTPLLDAQLSLWKPYLGVPEPDLAVPGYTYEKGKPIGLRDPKGVYTVKVVDGEPVLHVSGEIFGGLTSQQSFENFHLKFQFRWGEKKWAPRKDAPKRDGGLLYHAFGEHGFFMKTWMHSAQFQIQEGDVGDFFPLFENKAFKSDVPFENRRYTPGAKLQTRVGGVTHSKDYNEKPNGEWNTCEIIAMGADVVHVLNGQVVNVLRNLRYVDLKSADKKEIPLTSGLLQIQSEGAEMDFREIKIRRLEAFPEQYANALKQ